MSAMMPPEMSALQGQPPLAQLLQQQPLLDQNPPPPEQADPLSALQDAIHAVTSAAFALTDAQDTKDALQAATLLATIQTRVMKGAPGAAQG